MKAIDALTQQERVVLSFVAQGWRNATIARELFISKRTVENHLYHIFDKLGVSSRTEAVVYAVHAGLLSLEVSSSAHDQRVHSS